MPVVIAFAPTNIQVICSYPGRMDGPSSSRRDLPCRSSVLANITATEGNVGCQERRLLVGRLSLMLSHTPFLGIYEICQGPFECPSYPLKYSNGKELSSMADVRSQDGTLSLLSFEHL